MKLKVLAGLFGFLACSAQAGGVVGDYCFDPYRAHYEYGTSMFWHEQIAHWTQLRTMVLTQLEQTSRSRQQIELKIKYPVQAGVSPAEGARLPRSLANVTAVQKYYNGMYALAMFCMYRATANAERATEMKGVFDAPPVKYPRPMPPQQEAVAAGRVAAR